MRLLLGIAWVIVLSGCGVGSDDGTINYRSNTLFSEGDGGWTAGFADYPVGLSESDSLDHYAFRFGMEPLPEGIIPAGTAFRLSSHNRNEDVFMYLAGRLGGVASSVNFRVHLTVEYVTDATEEQPVFLKVGATTSEIRPLADSGIWRLNVDKGNHGNAGFETEVLGRIGINTTTGSYRRVVRSTTTGIRAASSRNGNIWLYVGTESAYPGVTDIYITRIDARLEWER